MHGEVWVADQAHGELRPGVAWARVVGVACFPQPCISRPPRLLSNPPLLGNQVKLFSFASWAALIFQSFGYLSSTDLQDLQYDVPVRIATFSTFSSVLLCMLL